MKDNNMLEWTEISRKILNKCRIFDLYQVEKISPHGDQGNFFLLDAPDWVTVIPLLKDNKGIDCFLMVEQYRHGSNEITLEFPAGMVDDGEMPLKAAKRELLEETGYSSGKIIEIGAVSPNPAFMNNLTYTFIADDLDSIAEQALDNDEFIHFHLIPCKDVIDKMGTGRYSNGIMMIALAFYIKWKESNVF